MSNYYLQTITFQSIILSLNFIIASLYSKSVMRTILSLDRSPLTMVTLSRVISKTSYASSSRNPSFA